MADWCGGRRSPPPQYEQAVFPWLVNAMRALTCCARRRFASCVARSHASPRRTHMSCTLVNVHKCVGVDALPTRGGDGRRQAYAGKTACSFKNVLMLEC